MARAKVADAEILEYLRRKAESMGRPPKARECGDGPVCPASIVQRFGGWRAALRAAGIDPDAGREAKRRAVLDRLRALAAELGRAPCEKDWQGPPSYSTVVNLFGSWSAALGAAGLEPSPRQRRFADSVDAAKRMVVERLRRLAEELGRPPARKDWQGPVSFQTVCRLFGGWLAALRAAGLEPGPRQRRLPAGRDELRRAAIIEGMRSLAEELGRTPRMADWRGSVGTAAVLRCFGTWNAAVEAAGLKPNRPTFRRIRAEIFGEEILQSLRRLAQELGRRPTYGDLLGPVAASLGCPCPATVCRRFGSFAAALEAAGLSGLPAREGRRQAAARRAEELAAKGFVFGEEAADPLVRRELRRRGVPVLRLGGWSSQPLRTVLEWLRGVPARGVLPTREEIRAAMGDTAFAFVERWIAGATLREIGSPEGLTRERVRQIMARGARQAVLRLASAGREGRPREPLLPREKVRLALKALRKATVVRDLVSLAAAISELEEAVKELRGAVDGLGLLAGR